MKRTFLLAIVAVVLTSLGAQSRSPLDGGAGLNVALAVAEHRDGGIVISGLWLEGQPLQAWQLPSECAGGEPSTCRFATPLDYEATYAGPRAGWLLSISHPTPSTRLDHINTVGVWSGGQDSTLLTSFIVNRSSGGSSDSASTLALVLSSASLTKSSRGARKLLEEDCSLTVAGTTHTFDGCSPASARNSGIKLFYSLTPGENGEGAVLRGGLKVSGVGPEGWAGWGLGTENMVGANAVIVKTDAASKTGASVAGYELPSYSAAAINDAAGSFPLTDASAALDSNGDLVAVFTASLPGSPSDLASSPFNYIWATGPLGNSGALKRHSLIGSESLELKVSTAAAPAPSPEPAAAQPATSDSPEPTCSLVVGSSTNAFQGCSPVPTTAANPPSAIQLFYSLTPGSDGEGTTLLRGGLRASGQSAEGWAGWGPASMSMLGSKAVIVKRDDASRTGASVAGYTLESYDAPAINNAAGSWELADASAAVDGNGDLVAVFTVSLPGSLSDLTSSPSPYIWAWGALNGVGALNPHTERGSDKLDFSAPAAVTPGSGSGAAAPAAAPAPSPSADEPPKGEQGADAAVSGVQQACTLQLGGSESASFAACSSIPGLGNPLSLLWSILPPEGPSSSSGSARRLSQALDTSTTASSTTRVLMALSGSLEGGEGYLAVGFPASPGQMEGATAFILQTCPSCDNGASIQDYYLGGYSQSAVQPPGRLPASNFTATSFTSNGATVLSGSFVVELDSALVSSPATNLIFAVGSLSSSGAPVQHDSESSADIALQDGLVSNVKSGSNDSKKAAHAWLMAIGWGVLIPSGIVMARCFKELDPLWFKLHRAVQTLGFLVGVAGFGVGFAIRSSWETPYPVHRNMGVAVLSLAVVQMTALFARPDKSSSMRRFWNWGHWWLGRAAAALAIANIYYGIINVQKLGTWAWATYTAILALIVAVAVVKDGMDFAQGRRTLCGREEAASTASSSEQELPSGKSAKSGLASVATDGSSMPVTQV